MEALGQLSAGDFLVHADHGIGIYRGLVELEAQGVSGEFLSIEYAEVTRLFLPVHRLNLVQRYAGSDGHVPRIDTLGGSSWVGVYGLRMVLLAVGIAALLRVGAHPLGLLLGLSLVMPAVLWHAWRTRPPVDPEAAALAPDDPAWKAWDPWLARERDEVDDT